MYTDKLSVYYVVAQVNKIVDKTYYYITFNLVYISFNDKKWTKFNNFVKIIIIYLLNDNSPVSQTYTII